MYKRFLAWTPPIYIYMYQLVSINLSSSLSLFVNHLPSPMSLAATMVSVVRDATWQALLDALAQLVYFELSLFVHLILSRLKPTRSFFPFFFLRARPTLPFFKYSISMQNVTPPCRWDTDKCVGSDPLDRQEKYAGCAEDTGL